MNNAVFFLDSIVNELFLQSIEQTFQRWKMCSREFCGDKGYY